MGCFEFAKEYCFAKAFFRDPPRLGQFSLDLIVLPGFSPPRWCQCCLVFRAREASLSQKLGNKDGLHRDCWKATRFWGGQEISNGLLLKDLRRDFFLKTAPLVSGI